MILQNVISLILGIVVGLMMGIPFGMFLGGRQVSVNLRTFTGFAVIIVWVLFMSVSLIQPTLQVPTALHGIAFGVVSALFGEEYFKRK